MAKLPKRYIDVDPWIIRETGYHPERARVSESLFALANERMGLRGSFEEGFSGDTMPGFYFNGIYASGTHQYSTRFKGFADRWTYVVNAVDWTHCRITVNGEVLDLATSQFQDFMREVDMREGVLKRRFTWILDDKTRIQMEFERFVSMVDTRLGAQQVRLTADRPAEATIEPGINFSTLYHLRGIRPWRVIMDSAEHNEITALGTVDSSGHRIFASARHVVDAKVLGETRLAQGELRASQYRIALEAGRTATLAKLVAFHTEKDSSVPDDEVWQCGNDSAASTLGRPYDAVRSEQIGYWQHAWKTMDVEIEGDDENQQGFRFCLFHLHQTYHGENPAFNIGAKGLTGEHYWGVTFWDTEIYCLPFYLFNDRAAARNLVDYRFRTLPGARMRSRDFRLPGARYPMCTIDGEEVCDVWQHGDLEIHVSAAVAHAVHSYCSVTGDDDFLFHKGVEILVETARFYAARGGWGQTTGKFGFWGVMGPDEMHMMVNNNAYTNYMAKLTFEHAIATVTRMRDQRPSQYRELADRLALTPAELADWSRKAEATELLHDPRTGLFEQFEGYFNMPRLDYHSIPDEEFPLRKNWAYVDTFRFDIIKQPDVLLFLFLDPDRFDRETLRRNFRFYEPRCTHESSLSPAIHSILAAWIDDLDLAFHYARYASRIDLDDYNNNTREGLHVTSMGGAWMNLVQGFAGLRWNDAGLHFAPRCPESWNAFSFHLRCGTDQLLHVRVTRDHATFHLPAGAPLTLTVHGQPVTVTNQPLRIPNPHRNPSEPA